MGVDFRGSEIRSSYGNKILWFGITVRECRSFILTPPFINIKSCETSGRYLMQDVRKKKDDKRIKKVY